MKRFIMIFLFFAICLSAKYLFYFSLLEKGIGLGKYKEISVYKCNLFLKESNIGLGTCFFEMFRTKEDSVSISYFPITSYFLLYVGKKKFPIIYSYFKIAPFLLEDMKLYWKFGLGINIFILNIEFGYYQIRYYPETWGREKGENFYLTGILSLGLFKEIK